MKRRPVLLTILDGWGHRAETHGNAIAAARKPVYDRLLREYPNTLIRASEHFVGLPDGQMGNSEVGHLNLGAGRVVRMDMTRIDVCSCVSGWPRYVADFRGGVSGKVGSALCGVWRRGVGECKRAVLCDGPRYALGTGAEGVQRDGEGAG